MLFTTNAGFPCAYTLPGERLGGPLASPTAGLPERPERLLRSSGLRASRR